MIDWTVFKFFHSPYFIDEPDNWHLKEDAPEDIKKEFEEAMKQYREPCNGAI